MKRRLSILLLLLSLCCYADNQDEVKQNLSNLSKQINTLSQDLQYKTTQNVNLNKSITDSQLAIEKSKFLLSSLRKKRDMDLQQITQINQQLAIMQQDTHIILQNVNNSLNQIYQKLVQLNQNDSTSILQGNSKVNQQQQKVYLTSLFIRQQSQYNQLKNQLSQLENLHDQLADEINRLNSKLGMTNSQQQKLIQVKQDKIAQQQVVRSQISDYQKKIIDLKQRQQELSSLLVKLKKDAAASRYKRAKSVTSSKKYANNTQVEQSGGSLFQHQLVKPVNAKIIVQFGAKRDGIASNGVVFAAINQAVFSIDDGVVIYVGNLPGFGNVIVVNHGDNYLSVYGGVIPKVKKDQNVSIGQVIANAGNSNNQPMDGVYFEIRHLGNPVNPGNLVK